MLPIMLQNEVVTESFKETFNKTYMEFGGMGERVLGYELHVLAHTTSPLLHWTKSIL